MDLTDLVADTGVNKHFSSDESLPNSRIGRYALEQLNWWIA